MRQGDETRIIEMQGKTFYNSGAPLMLGVLSDATPASQSATTSVAEKLARKKSARLAS
jgi:hypothetical protein